LPTHGSQRFVSFRIKANIGKCGCGGCFAGQRTCPT
jgi:hypothetical protein